MPKVPEEEWNEDQVVWLTYRQMFAITILISEFQIHSPKEFAINSEVIKELAKAKAKLLQEVRPTLLPEEIEKNELEEE